MIVSNFVLHSVILEMTSKKKIFFIRSILEKKVYLTSKYIFHPKKKKSNSDFKSNSNPGSVKS